MAVNGEVEISEYFRACLYFYNGLPCVKAIVGGRGCTYTFRCAEFDSLAIAEEFDTPGQTVELKAWIDAQKTADRYKVNAKQNCGVWTAPEYARR